MASLVLVMVILAKDCTAIYCVYTDIRLLQVFCGVCNSVQQTHSQGNIFTLNLHSVVRHIHKNISKLGWAVNLNGALQK